MIGAARKPEQEAGGEQVAGAGGVDQLVDRRGRHRFRDLSRVTTTQPFSLRVTAASLASLRSAATRRIEIGGLVEAFQLALVGEQKVDGAVADELEEFVAIAADAEGIRQA